MSERNCSKNNCEELAMATLSFDYGQSIAVLGLLSPKAEPGCFDLCMLHASRFSAPAGWQLIRHSMAPTAKGN